MSGNIGIITRGIKYKHNKLQRKEKRLFHIFVVFISLFFYVNFFLKPLLKEISALKIERERTDKRAELLESQFPDVHKSNLELENIKGNIAGMEVKAVNIKAGLLNLSDVPRLLAKFIEFARGMVIDFRSVKQDIVTDKEGFSKLLIDLEFEADYETVINYVKNIEEVSSFIKIEKMDISQSEIDPRNLVGAALRISALLSLSPKAGAESNFVFERKEKGNNKVNVDSNPLSSKFSSGKVEKKTFTLNGITYRGEQGNSSAIINNIVVKAGDIIEKDYKIEAVLSDTVIISDGIEPKMLKIER